MKKLAAAAVLSVALLTGCAGPPSASAPTVTVTTTTTSTPSAAPTSTATPKATATPAAVKTSGNYGADLAAAGNVPDNVARYGQFMKEELCDAPLTKAPLRDYSKFAESIRTLASSATKDVASVRLSVAYFCPERKSLAEDALKLHGYT